MPSPSQNQETIFFNPPNNQDPVCGGSCALIATVPPLSWSCSSSTSIFAGEEDLGFFEVAGLRGFFWTITRSFSDSSGDERSDDISASSSCFEGNVDRRRAFLRCGVGIVDCRFGFFVDEGADFEGALTGKGCLRGLPLFRLTGNDFSTFSSSPSSLLLSSSSESSLSSSSSISIFLFFLALPPADLPLFLADPETDPPPPLLRASFKAVLRAFTVRFSSAAASNVSGWRSGPRILSKSRS